MPSDESDQQPRAADPFSRGGGSDAPALEDVLDQYLQELADGKKPDQEAYLRAHPDLADALRGVFKTLDFVEAASKSLNASQLEKGQQLGEYRIVREIGRGGMGVVYEAVQTSLGRRVALKVLPAGSLLSSNAHERFSREAATAGRLHHTNIVPVYAVGEEQGIHFYVMQHIEGRSLSDHLKRLRESGTAPGRDYYRRVARWARQVAEALDYAHEEGIVHRDVKPSNLLLDARDNVWITDFGLARMDTHATLTVSGDVLGTARYMSPEQARGGRSKVDRRTDIYSLGVTLYELLAFEPAFDGESREDVLNRIVFADPPPLRKLNPAVPRDLETIVTKCMTKQPEHRYEHARDVAEDCRRWLDDEPIRARRTPLTVHALRFARRHRGYVAVGVVMAMLTLATVWTVLRMRHIEGQQLVDEAYTDVLFERDADRAMRLLDEAESLGVDSPELHLCRGLVPLLDNQPQRAMDDLHAALRRDPAHVEANLAAALAYNMNADFVNGERILQRVPRGTIETALGWQLLGLALSKTHGSDAIDAFDQAIRVQADFTPAIGQRAHYRGVQLLTEGRRSELDPMLNDLDALVVFRPESARARAARAEGWLFAAAFATTQADLGDSRTTWLENCRQDVEAAIELQRPNDSLPWLRKGLYLRYTGDFAEAAEAFEQAIEIDRQAGRDVHPYRVQEKTLALHAMGEIEAALNEIAPASDAAPTWAPIALERALLLAELGRVAEARTIARRVLEENPRNLNALFLSASVLELLGEPEPAAAALHDAAAREDAGQSTEGGGQTQRTPELMYLVGRWSADELYAAAGNPARTCEAAYLVALREFGRGNHAAGVSALDRCLATQVIVFAEWRMARVLRARAETGPQWPRWVGGD